MQGFEIPLEMVISQGVFAVLFVWLFFETRKESKSREDKLMRHLEKTADREDRLIRHLEKTSNTLETLGKSLDRISVRIDHIDDRLYSFEEQIKSKQGG